MEFTKELFLKKINAYIQDRNIGNEKSFWLENKGEITKLVEGNVFNGEEFRTIKNAMDIFRGKYLMNSRYMTIDKDYQDMCKVFITLLLQKKALGVKNFLRYFDPNSAYYKRVETLDLFRNLSNPSEEIEGLLPIVGKNLYESVQLEPESLPKATNIFKEYIERIFSITRLDKNSRIDFLVISDDNLDYFYANSDLNEWLLNIIEQDEIKILETDDNNIIKESEKENIENIKDKSEETVGDVIENTKEDKESNQVEIQKNLDEGLINEFKEKFELLQKQYDSMKIENENRINELTNELNKLRNENVNLKINNLNKQESLQIKIEEYKAKNEELEKKYNNLQNTSETLLTTNEVVDEIPEKVPNEIAELRQFYNIVVVGGSEKTNKKFNRLMNDAEIATEIYKDWGLETKQFQLEGDYKKQKDKKLAKKVEDALSGNIANFVIILQSDHNTALTSLIENPEYTTRITVFGEREENDLNPAYGQKLSNSSFKHYLKRAITKYERDIINSMG